MNIRVAENSELIGCTTIIFREISELAAIELTKEEKDYVESSIDKEKFKIIRLNRYPRFIHLIKVTDGELGKEQYQEKQNIRNKLLRMIRAEKAKEMKVILKVCLRMDITLQRV